MFRIDNNSAVPTLPSPGPPGQPGFFTDGNPAAALEATIVDAWWANALQEEILHVITQAGIAPNKLRNTQLYEALNQLYATAGGAYLPLSGGLMEGFITLHAPPALPMHAANRQYVDDAIAGILAGTGYVPEAPPGPLTYGRLNAAWNPVLPLTGGNLSGPGNLALAGYLEVGGNRLYNQAGNLVSVSKIIAADLESNLNAVIAGYLEVGGRRLHNQAGNLISVSKIIAADLQSNLNVYVPYGIVEAAGNVISGWDVVANHGLMVWGNGQIVGDIFGGWDVFCGGGFYVGSHSVATATIRMVSGAASPSPGIELRVGTATKPGGGPWDPLISDGRVKCDITDYPRGLETLVQLRPRTFRFTGRGGILATDQTYEGLIAEEVASIAPEMVRLADVTTDDPELADLKTLRLNSLTYMLINAVRELADRLKSLEGVR